MSRSLPDDGILDETAIARRMAGDKTARLSYAERVELVRRWRATGLSVNQCERVTGLKVYRYEKRRQP